MRSCCYFFIRACRSPQNTTSNGTKRTSRHCQTRSRYSTLSFINWSRKSRRCRHETTHRVHALGWEGLPAYPILSRVLRPGVCGRRNLSDGSGRGAVECLAQPLLRCIGGGLEEPVRRECKALSYDRAFAALGSGPDRLLP